MKTGKFGKAIFLAASVMLFLTTPVFSGGGSGEKSPSTGTGKTKVTYWTYVDSPSQNQQLALTPADVEVEMILIPNAQYEQKLRVATNGGAAPDVFMVDGPYIANYAYNGMLKELTQYVDKAFWEDYVDSTKRKCSYNGKIWALSQNETAIVMFYNKDHFAEAGITDIPTTFANAWTQDRVIEAAVKLTKRDAAGNITQYGLNPTMNTPDMINEGMTFTLLNWLWNAGFEYVDPAYKTASGYLDSPASIKALQAYGELFTKYKVAPLQAVDQGFETGKFSMIIHNISMMGGYEKNFPNLHFGVMPIPKGVRHYGTTGGWAYGMSSQSKNPASAYKVLWAICGPAGHKIHVEYNKAMPSLKSLMDLPMFKNDPRMLIAVDTIKNARSRDIIPSYAEISPILNELCNSIAYGEDPKALVGPAIPKINRIIAKYPPLQ